ncbi:glycosyltransferase family 2 protein [Neomegalonema sp.]|uniref:glycosyltransferase family 2 protein n=1 Tax=Neomegalonema sp. TaxID=2039713 RepID=UPI00260FE50F|nr:glycosyltransferase family 2 protein [Neomegalonema sp.]MDD2867821.1 glycosyltransferase family 2 protein [Neomegalonema sp.]
MNQNPGDWSPGFRFEEIAPDRAPPPDLSFVVPACDEAESIAETLRRLEAKSLALGLRTEIVLVDDGSRDGTLEIAGRMVLRVPLRLVRLSRNFGKEQAIMAGLRQAAGAVVILLDADLQESLDHVDEMLARHREGFEMVYAVRAHRRDEPAVKRLLTRVFYRLLSYGEVEIPPDARDFRLMDRKVVDALCALPERNRFMKGLYGWVGFRSTALPIELAPRQGGRSKFRLGALLRLGVTGMTAFTSWPLRIWTLIGVGVAALSILYGIWLTVETLLWGRDLPGWSTLAVAIFFLSGVQLLSIGVLGEYVSRIFSEVKGRPGYVVAENREVPPRR